MGMLSRISSAWCARRLDLRANAGNQYLSSMVKQFFIVCLSLVASVHAQQLVEFDPRRAAGHVLLGEVALRQGRLEDAVEHARAVKESGDVTEAEAKWADEVIAGER